MDHRNVPSSRTVLIGSSLWMVVLSGLSAYTALVGGPAVQVLPLAAVSGASLAAALGFGKLAIVDFGPRADSQLRRRLSGEASRRAAKAA
ncbi:MAG: hypothetical protein ACM3US_01810 [Sphingomonadaceae bacterium]